MSWNSREWMFSVCAFVVVAGFTLTSGCNCGSTPSEPAAAAAAAPAAAPATPKYRFKKGELVEHFVTGRAVISTVDAPGDITNWPRYTIRGKDGKKFPVWEHELKKPEAGLDGYRSPGKAVEASDSEIDLDTQLMEEQIEQRILERLKKMHPEEVGDTGVEPR